jgi:hypothetical protein
MKTTNIKSPHYIKSAIFIHIFVYKGENAISEKLDRRHDDHETRYRTR